MIKKYIKSCKRLFPVYGKYEKQFLNKIKQQINEYVEAFPNTTYEELIDQFGSPKDVVISYYENVDDDYLLKKTNLVKTLRVFCVSFTFFLICFFGYRSYIIYQAYLDAKDTVIIHEYESIVDEGEE